MVTRDGQKIKTALNHFKMEKRKELRTKVNQCTSKSEGDGVNKQANRWR